ncbi:replicative DNA helicase [Paenibacillus rigui]|uniref:Replicative DNA helicase n=1 Tax=Paenibacillus rigui TaxID=554312 RepID=A0A229UMF4_9BACL|nr:replicative DNA helicase [Paenibacillus rigui]OXM84590.1 replicative DNA helicase [Paenibacillus rigui]
MPDAIELADFAKQVEAEQAIIGAVLLSNEAILNAMDRLLPEDFFQSAHRIIFESMLELWDAAETETPIDLVTLAAHLNQRGQLEHIGGITYLSELSQATPTAANIDYYAKLVLDASLDRMTRAGMKRIYENSDLTAAEMAEQAQRVAEEIAERSAANKGGFKPFKEAAMRVYDRVEQSYTQPAAGGVTGISSGYPDLDKMTSGFQPQDLVIVGARPSVGKTAFALNVAQAAGKTSGETIAIFSLEMSAEQLVQRMISAEGNVDASRLRTGHLEGDDWEKMTMAIGTLSDAHIYIDDSPGVTVNDIRSRCRQLKKETGSLGLILIDYLQLISSAGRSENRQQEISKISRTLKQIARELDTTVIALSQLSRGVEQRQDKRPMMSDLRESGSIEQDADIVAFLYRDDYYDKESEKKNVIEIIIAKQRNGPVGTVELAFLKNFNKFVSLDRTHQETASTSRPMSSKKNQDRRWA